MKIENFFKLKEYETNIKTEIIAGITMFRAMVFMIIVTPSILSKSNMDGNRVFTATISAALTCFILV